MFLGPRENFFEYATGRISQKAFKHKNILALVIGPDFFPLMCRLTRT
jgi:hypothetical protein